MPRYAAFLRGVGPSIVAMPELVRAFEAAGFTDVRTLLTSGNVLFTTPVAPVPALEQRAERAMTEALGRSFWTTVRSIDALRALLATDPYAPFDLPSGAKRVVTFLREPPASPSELPVERDGARILAIRGAEAFSAYVPSPKGPVFMTLIEKTLGKEATTRTWETVAKAAR